MLKAQTIEDPLSSWKVFNVDIEYNTINYSLERNTLEWNNRKRLVRLISFEKKLGGNGNVDGKKAVQQLFENSGDYFLILEILEYIQ